VLVERFQDSARVKAWRSADEHDHLLKFKGAELRYNLFDAALVEQQDSRDHILGHAFSGGPAHFLWIKIDTETIGHGAGNIIRRQKGCISKPSKGFLVNTSSGLPVE
jgi:hypothetical protein